MKIIAWYLPQFHETPENNEWWGNGFTEWTNVKKGKQLYSDQYQPRVPQNQNYYDLLNPATAKWQVNLAKQYGIYGFCMYHYWFDGKLLLNKPVENYLQDASLNLPFCLCWANDKWTNCWKSDDPTILIDQNYGKEEMWQKHFDYFLPFFQDPRYIRNDGKPMLGIYCPEGIPCLDAMIAYWQEAAQKAGLPGISLFYQGLLWNDNANKKDDSFDFEVIMEPAQEMKAIRQQRKKGAYQLKRMIPLWAYRVFEKPLFYLSEYVLRHWNQQTPSYLYEEVWQRTVSLQPNSMKQIPGAFSDWDNTCRKGQRGTYLSGANPEVFKKYFKQLVSKTKEIYHKDMIFFFAWNEWAESGYLEPDEKYGSAYLQAIHDVLVELEELPHDSSF